MLRLRLEAPKKAAQEGTKGWWQRWNTISAECSGSVFLRVEALIDNSVKDT